jgi:hypothetical protein
VLFSADLTGGEPAALLEVFLEEAGVDRVRTDPDDPAGLHAFRLPTLDGEVYAIASREGRREVTITSAPQPVTLGISRSPMVLAALDSKGRLVACETDGPVRVAGRTVIDANASVMAFTLDRKPMEESSSLVLLPQPYRPADIAVRAGPEIDFVVIGEPSEGAWRTREEWAAERSPEGVKIHLDADQSLCVVLLVRRAEREGWIRSLAAFLEGYLEGL